MGRHHCGEVLKVEGLELVALCDIDRPKLEAAIKEAEGKGLQLKGYDSLGKLLKDPEVDLVVLATPHDVHCEQVVACAKAGKHVIVEKVMCLNVREADKMIAACDAAGVMFSAYHNRRWDSDFLGVKRIIEQGIIGEPFQIEGFVGGWGAPGGWRRDKKHGGGNLYDWGAHLIDQALLIAKDMPRFVEYRPQYRVWGTDTENHVKLWLTFESGLLYDIEISQIARVSKPRWRALGEKGALQKDGWDAKEPIRVVAEVGGIQADMRLECVFGDWTDYYRNIADVLLRGKELIVKPEESRNGIRVIEAAQKSFATGKTVAIA
jgi:scyllo-inositol 2-dehydrogenase (NADP+)